MVLPTSSRNSRLYARFKTVRRDEYVQKHCDLQDKKHENTILSGEREAAASVVRAAIVQSVCVCVCVCVLRMLRSWFRLCLVGGVSKSSVGLNSLVTTYVVYGLCLPACRWFERQGRSGRV